MTFAMTEFFIRCNEGSTSNRHESGPENS